MNGAGTSSLSDSRTDRGMRWAWGAACAALAGLCIFLIGSKIRTLHAASQFDPVDESGLFWTESAFHYRYAKMVASGRKLPETDYAMQYPEGIGVFRDEMPVMEMVGGTLYRWLAPKGLPFHVFLLRLVSGYSSLVLVPAFLLSAVAFRRPLAALTTVLFYMLTFPAIGSVVLFAYVRQDFALPILFLASAIWLAGVEYRNRSAQAAGALGMALAFASWHLAQFYWTVLLAGCTVAYFWQPAWRDRIAGGIAVMTAFLAAAAILVPALRSGWLLASTAMLASYALLLTHAAFRHSVSRTLLLGAVFLALFFAFLAAASWFGAEHLDRYSHVYRLMFDKIRFLGIKPDDPLRMSFESRVMWTSSFLSPTWWSARRWMGGAWLAGAWGAALIIGDARRRGLRFLDTICLWMGVAFVILFALIQRMDVFAAFFVCVWAGRAAPAELPASPRALAKAAILVALLVYSWHNLITLYMVSGAPPPSQLRPLLTALRAHTQTNDVILAHFPLSPVICAHTDRPVVLHSKFENRRVREKVREFYEAFFEREDTLANVCKKYGVRYVVYQPEIALSTTKEAIRYMTARMDLTDEAAAVRMQFSPEALRWFQLVFQTDHFRVYRVLDYPRAPGPLPFPKPPVYDSRNFRREDVRIRPASP